MAKQTEFESPPEGHIGLLVYDSVNNKWYAVLGDSGGRIQLDVTVDNPPSGFATEAKQLADGHNVTVDNLPSGFATEAKQLADGHNVTVDNVSILVTGAFYQVTQPVSAASLPLPTGAAIESKQLAAGHDVTVDNASIEVTQDAPADLKISQHQYHGDAWRKSNLLWGYYDRWYQDFSGSAEGDEFSAISTAVDAGYIHVMQGLSIRNNTRAGTNREIDVKETGGDVIVLNYEPGAAQYVPTTFIGALCLKEGDYVLVSVSGCQADDVIQACVWGYKMKIDM